MRDMLMLSRRERNELRNQAAAHTLKIIFDCTQRLPNNRFFAPSLIVNRIRKSYSPSERNYGAIGPDDISSIVSGMPNGFVQIAEVVSTDLPAIMGASTSLDDLPESISGYATRTGYRANLRNSKKITSFIEEHQ